MMENQQRQMQMVLLEVLLRNFSSPQHLLMKSQAAITMHVGKSFKATWSEIKIRLPDGFCPCAMK